MSTVEFRVGVGDVKFTFEMGLLCVRVIDGVCGRQCFEFGVSQEPTLRVQVPNNHIS